MLGIRNDLVRLLHRSHAAPDGTELCRGHRDFTRDSRWRNHIEGPAASRVLCLSRAHSACVIVLNGPWQQIGECLEMRLSFVLETQGGDPSREMFQ